MTKYKFVRLREDTVKVMTEVSRLRTKEATRTREIFAKLMDSARGIWTPNESVLFLANFYLKNRKRK